MKTFFYHARSWALACAVFAAFLPASWASGDRPNPATDSVILVATEALVDPVYAQSVLIARPAANGMHVGIILNKQTPITLATLFPAHEPSKGVKDNVFFGGPMTSNAIAAVIQKYPGEGQKGVIEFTKDLYMVLSSDAIDAIIESAPNDARYYVGNVIWRPGELAMELDKGMWIVLPVSNEIVFRKNTSGLWKSLNEDSKLLYTGMPVPATVLALLPR
ncbi:MAG: YqgE/AlgH family protein [Burkholderiales bacterium]|jgi:putative transcriptional regulator